MDQTRRRAPGVVGEAATRRTFAIISHPDAGKTTLTEKLLLYAGAIEEAGAVKARAGRQRDATSDWMEMERQRGISISATVLQFEYGGCVINLLDTPGHRDFSEDTYRVLSAVDAAVIVLDAAKGIEEQTLKLFQVARRRGIPILTFVNKCDRPGLGPLELLDSLDRELGLVPTPVTWPVGMGPDFAGVVDRRDGALWRFERTARGASEGAEHRQDAFDPAVGGHALVEELGLLDEIGADHDPAQFLAGVTSPVFFGSALWNFGVRLLLDGIVGIAPSPGPRTTASGEPVPLDGECAGFVFKVQANLDPRHRDRIAYVRVCSGRFERGMTLLNHRTGRPFSTKYAHQLFGRERDTVEEAVAGDVVGLVNASELRVGDSLSESGRVEFPPIPTFTPEHFMTARNLDASRYKQFRRGLGQLEEEGVIQVLRHPDRGDQQPVLAAVGPMQYEVAAYRLESEYGARIGLAPTPWTVARRTDAAGAEALAAVRDVEVLTRTDGTVFALFRHRSRVEAVARDLPDVVLDEIVVG
jgi:peptide chain release factor 3